MKKNKFIVLPSIVILVLILIDYIGNLRFFTIYVYAILPIVFFIQGWILKDRIKNLILSLLFSITVLIIGFMAFYNIGFLIIEVIIYLLIAFLAAYIKTFMIRQIKLEGSKSIFIKKLIPIIIATISLLILTIFSILYFLKS
ncbi:MAG: hypothetical protein ACRC41_05290 [Sarcina sp.]